MDLGDWSRIAPLFDQLEADAPQCRSCAAFERWLLDGSELTAALDEESSRRYIAMTCHTENGAAEAAFLHFIGQIEPRLKPRQFKLARIFLAHPMRAQLPGERYFVFDRATQLQVELFRPENVPLETEEARLSQQYQKLIGSLTVPFRGEEQTLARMGRYLEDPDRALRQEAWEVVTRRRLREAEHIEQIFEQLLKWREQIAAKGKGEQKKEHVGYKVQVAGTVCEAVLAPGEPRRNFISGIVTHAARESDQQGSQKMALEQQALGMDRSNKPNHLSNG